MSTEREELPLWLKAIEGLKAEHVEAVLRISHYYNLAPKDFIENAIQEKLDRYFSEHPDLKEMLERQKKQSP
jgi:hypothetical protein